MLIAILAFSTAVAEEEVRQISLGPLVRFDPNARQLKNLLAVHGDPGIGLTAAHSGISDRVGNTGKWIVGLAGVGGIPVNVALMEFVSDPGGFRQREILRLNEATDVSSNERAVFGCRRGMNMEDIWECFSLVDNHSPWTVEKDVSVMKLMENAFPVKAVERAGGRTGGGGCGEGAKLVAFTRFAHMDSNRTHVADLTETQEFGGKSLRGRVKKSAA